MGTDTSLAALVEPVFRLKVVTDTLSGDLDALPEDARERHWNVMYSACPFTIKKAGSTVARTVLACAVPNRSSGQVPSGVLTGRSACI